MGVMWLLAITTWIQHTPNALSQPSAYDIFPLFGLMAFSALLGTYIVNAASTYFKIAGEKLSQYYQTMGYAILILILSHPTTLLTRLYMDGFGLPPHSYSAYVNPNYVWVVWLGTISLFVFLAFELHRWFSRRTWWKWIVYANDLAMLLIFYHGMTLGTELQSSASFMLGWFRYIWWFYGLILVAAIVYLRYFAKRHRR